MENSKKVAKPIEDWFPHNDEPKHVWRLARSNPSILGGLAATGFFALLRCHGSTVELIGR
jgi:hypothetical protein